MTDRLASPTVAPRPSTLLESISIAGLVLLGSACAGEGPVAPTAVHGPVAAATVSMARAASERGPATCVPNARLIGRIALSTADEPGTWWYLTREGLAAMGVADADYEATMEGWFGREFSSLDEAISFLVAQVPDANGNGFVCAYRLRGTRTSIGLPGFAHVLFEVHDDKHAAN